MQNVESVIEKIKELVNADFVVLVGTVSPEISGVIDDGDELYREILPLGQGIHIVLSLMNPTDLGTGIHEI